ncbi:sugar-binding domain-containing protein, partial [Pseudoalteromonas agarivorans]|uniref:sugar-binding domain-containing protein n=1 Tax=Pseudoalteromonas agarivorans TaxID=176102 RepID=UPI00311E296E
DELPTLDCSKHKVVAMLGNMALDGSASQYDVVVRMSEHINAKHYPMPLPLLPRSDEEKQQIHAQHNITTNLKLAT